MTHSTPHLSEELRDCIELCTECHQTCLNMAMTHCLTLGGKHTEMEHFQLMIACAEVCQAAANVMLTGSALHGAVCTSCAELCFACAQSCQQVGDMDACVDCCQRCAESCEAMAKDFKFHFPVNSGQRESAVSHA